MKVLKYVGMLIMLCSLSACSIVIRDVMDFLSWEAMI